MPDHFKLLGRIKVIRSPVKRKDLGASPSLAANLCRLNAKPSCGWSFKPVSSRCESDGVANLRGNMGSNPIRRLREAVV